MGIGILTGTAMAWPAQRRKRAETINEACMVIFRGTGIEVNQGLNVKTVPAVTSSKGSPAA